MKISSGDDAKTVEKATSEALLLEIATKHFHSIETLEDPQQRPPRLP